MAQRSSCGDRLAGERIDLGDPLDLVAPELDADRLLLVGREDLDGVAAHPEGARLEARRRCGCTGCATRSARMASRPALARPRRRVTISCAVLDRVAEAVDGAHRGDDDHVLALHQARRGAQPERLDVLVDRGVLLDVDVGRRGRTPRAGSSRSTRRSTRRRWSGRNCRSSP